MALSPVLRGSYDPSYARETPTGSVTAGLRPAPAAPVEEQSTPFGFDQASNKVWVNGLTFDADDHRSALESKSALDAPVQQMPVNFRPMELEEFGGYIQRIKDPSIGRLMSKNFGIGVDNLQLIGGAALSFAGAEELGGKIIRQQEKDLGFNEPYQRIATRDFMGDPVGWFVANFAQQGPNLIESVVTALVGAGVGAAAGGGPNPFTAIGGAAAALGGKQALKQSLLAAAKKKAAGETLKPNEADLLRKAAGIHAAKEVSEGKMAQGAAADVLITPNYSSSRALVPTGQGGALVPYTGQEAMRIARSKAVREQADLRDGARDILKRGRKQGATGGAVAASLAQNYGMGIGDIYSEVLETGEGDRLDTLRGAAGYALLETAPEFIFASRLFGGLKGKATRGSALKRGSKGLGLGALAEGGVEVAQEGIIMDVTNQLDLSDEEVQDRLLNSFFAGAAVGGPLGAGANIIGGDTTSAEITPPDGPRGLEFRGLPDEPPGGGIDPDSGQPVSLLGGSTTPLLSGPQEGIPGPDAPAGELPPLGPRDLRVPGRDVEGYTYDGEILGPETPTPPGPLPSLPGDDGAAAALPYEPLSPAQNLAQEGVDYNVPINGPPVPNAEAVAVPPGLPGIEGAPQGELNLDPGGITTDARVRELFGQQREQVPGTGFVLPETGEASVVPRTALYTGEPTVIVPVRDAKTGRVVATPMPVRQTLEDSQQRVEALEALRKCLARNS